MEVVEEIKNGNIDIVGDPIAPPPNIDVIWSTTDGIQLTPFTNENLPEIGGCQVSSILSTIEERSRDADYAGVLTHDVLPQSASLDQFKSIAFNVCSTETNNLLPVASVNGRRQRNVILPSGQKQLYEEMVFFGCNLCPFICTKDSKISDHIDSVHRNPQHNYNRLKLKCPGCTNVFHHKLSLRSHLIYDHEVGKSDINKIVNGIVYVSSMMNNESTRLKPNGALIEEDVCDDAETNASKKQEMDFLQEDDNHVSSEEECEQETETTATTEPETIEPIAPPIQIEPRIESKEVLEETVKIDLKENGSEAKLPLKCGVPTCTARLRRPSSAAYHASCHVRDSARFQCKECSWPCTSWRTMQTHLWTEHKIDIDMYACDKCEYRTHCLSKLNNIHRLIHGDAKPYLCDDCGKGFKNPKQLRNHKLVHRSRDGESQTDSSIHTCTKCQRQFRHRRQLKVHIQSVHDKIKPFSCNECDYKAASKAALQLHIRSQHTGERPFKCDQCEYATSDHNTLRRHRLRHTGVKKYSCPHCSYACIQSSTYKVHMRTKHPGQEAGAVHTCEHCQFRTLSMQKFIVHMATHQGS